MDGWPKSMGHGKYFFKIPMKIDALTTPEKYFSCEWGNNYLKSSNPRKRHELRMGLTKNKKEKRKKKALKRVAN